MCPCKSGKAYGDCCEPFHLGKKCACPELLMRSRYTAYSLGLAKYILSSWHEMYRPPSLDLTDDGIKWIDLKIINRRMISAVSASVEFKAKYLIAGKTECLHELRQFEKINGSWYYKEGEHSLS